MRFVRISPETEEQQQMMYSTFRGMFYLSLQEILHTYDDFRFPWIAAVAPSVVLVALVV